MMHPMMREVMDLSMMMESFVEMAPEEMRRIAIETIKKGVSYVANGTNSNQILSISGTASDSAVKTTTPKAIEAPP